MTADSHRPANSATTPSLGCNANFNHNSTGFALTGSHSAPRQCTECHVNNNYNLTNTACVICHQTDYNNTTDPVNHMTAGFPHDLRDSATTPCSGPTRNSNHTTTGFPLTGAHTSAARCARECHVNNNYNLNSTTALLVPPEGLQRHHQSRTCAGWIPDSTCEMCHDTTVVDGRNLQPQHHDFPADRFAHSSAAAVHAIATSTTITRRCRRPASAATRPITTTPPIRATRRSRNSSRPLARPATTRPAGLNATFNTPSTRHSRPTTANANGVCSTCHTKSNDYSVFQCTNCHTKNRPTAIHQGVKGYVYNSVNCYQCHQNGQGGG